MKVCCLILIFLSFLAPCHGRYHEPSYTTYVSEIEQNFSKKMREELGLRCCGTNGKMPADVENIGMSFNFNGRATVEEARALTVYVTERFVEAINAHEKIRPHLREYPFPSTRVDICISFNNLLGDPNADGSVYYISHLCSWVYYRAYDAFEDKLVTFLEEPYEEAARIVKASSLPIPPRHETTPLESSIDDIFYIFCQEMAEEHGLYVWSIGCKKGETLEEIDARFTVFSPASQEKARATQVMATEKLLELVNTHEVLKPYLTEYPFTPARVKMRLNFRDKKYNSYNDGTMESVTLKENELIYYREPLWREGDPLSKLCQPIIHVATEPYPLARQMVEEMPFLKPKPAYTYDKNRRNRNKVISS